MNLPLSSHALSRLWPLRDKGRPAPVETPAPASPDGPVAHRAPAAPAPRRLAEAFTPTRPQFAGEARMGAQRAARRLIGREAELARILRALREDHAHVVLYGGRGQGKTSLANAVAAEARETGLALARCVCSASSDFDSVLRSLARNLPPARIGLPVPAEADTSGCADLLPPTPLQPGDAFALVPRMKDTRLVLLVDEFDRITDRATLAAFADTIKQISDRGAAISFLLIGVSDILEQLVEQHPSIQRCVAAVPLRLLTKADVEELVLRGGQAAGMQFPQAVRAAIATLSRGLPYIAQLLALRAAQSAADQGRSAVGGSDLAAAIAAAVEETDARIVLLHDTLTQAGRDGAVLALLRAAAGGRCDAFGRFHAARDVASGRLLVAGVPADPAAWERLLRADAVRACTAPHQEIFAFSEAMLPHYVLLSAVRDAARR
jgi:hypothetical protein